MDNSKERIKVDKLVEDIEKLGYPTILAYHRGLMIGVTPDRHSIKNGDLMFSLGSDGQAVCRVSNQGDVYLVEKKSEHKAIKFARNYSLRQKDTDQEIGELYWIEKIEIKFT